MLRSSDAQAGIHRQRKSPIPWRNLLKGRTTVNARTEGSEDHGQHRDRRESTPTAAAAAKPDKTCSAPSPTASSKTAPSERHDGVKRPDHRNGVQAEVNHPAAKSNARAIRRAGVELQRDPERLQVLGTKIDTVEKVFYPPWPGGEIKRPDTEHTQEKPEDIFDEDGDKYARQLEQRANEQYERGRRILQDPPAQPPAESPKPARPPAAPKSREQASPSR